MSTDAEPLAEAAVDFTQVCEAPGAQATDESLSMMLTRYHFAAEHVRDRDVLELACGSGSGLGYLAQSARRVTGGDIDSKNLAPALEQFAGHNRIRVQLVDAMHCPFEDGSFGAVILLDSIYWLPAATAFIAEARRLLQPGGVLVLSMVNPEWHGFHPSPQAVRYFNIPELAAELRTVGFEPEFHVGFIDQPSGFRSRCVAGIRRVASKAGLIPTSVAAKEKLKRIFYGPLKAFPAQVDDTIAPLEKLRPVPDDYRGTQDKIIYVAAELSADL